MAVHAGEHVVGDVLQGDVEILAHVGTRRYDVEQLQGKLVGVGIMEANPLYALYVGHVVYELGDVTLAVDVDAIIGQLLGNDLYLLHA